MNSEEGEIRRQIARLNARAWGIAGGLTLGIGLFAVTNILLLVGPAPGHDVGETLVRLRYFLPGYSVTVLGSVIGFVYGFVIGYALGRAVGSIYNRLISVPQTPEI